MLKCRIFLIMEILERNSDEGMSQDAILMSIAQSTVASFKLEGINLTIDEAYKMAVASAEKILKK